MTSDNFNAARKRESSARIGSVRIACSRAKVASRNVLRVRVLIIALRTSISLSRRGLISSSYRTG
eukprot:scaffold140029_cov34-Prasinocladus_malaysianus.AAC.1